MISNTSARPYRLEGVITDGKRKVIIWREQGDGTPAPLDEGQASAAAAMFKNSDIFADVHPVPLDGAELLAPKQPPSFALTLADGFHVVGYEIRR